MAQKIDIKQIIGGWSPEWQTETIVCGSLNFIKGGITGSLFGTASYSLTASYVDNIVYENIRKDNINFTTKEDKTGSFHQNSKLGDFYWTSGSLYVGLEDEK